MSSSVLKEREKGGGGGGESEGGGGARETDRQTNRRRQKETDKDEEREREADRERLRDEQCREAKRETKDTDHRHTVRDAEIKRTSNEARQGQRPEAPVERDGVVLQDVQHAALRTVLVQDARAAHLHTPTHETAQVGVLQRSAEGQTRTTTN